MTMLARIGLIFILGCVICSSADEVQSGNIDANINAHRTETQPGEIGVNVTATEHESGSTTNVRIAYTEFYLRN